MGKHDPLNIVSLTRVTHKGWDYKDDLKLKRYDDPEVKLSFLLWMCSLHGLFHDLSKTERSWQSEGTKYIRKQNV